MFLIGMMGSTPALAGSAYDPWIGNFYTWSERADGGLHLRGWNWNTGSLWSAEYEPSGDMRGFDSRGHFWQYRHDSGFYWNSDGTVCIGKGAGRTCF